MTLPWHERQWQYLWQAHLKNRLPHALLFAGIKGLGKTQFVTEFTHALLCQNIKKTLPCYKCHACRLVSGQVHPNVYWILPEKEGQAIKVDQIREASAFIYQTSLQGQYRILIINPADDMNHHAANALLKSLEEPPVGVIFMLVSDQYGQLPATILSRCQRVVFLPPSEEEALQWLHKKLTPAQKKVLDEVGMHAELLLRLAEGAPMTAIQLIKDDILALRKDLYHMLAEVSHSPTAPTKMAEILHALSPLQFINLMISWVIDVMRLQFGISEEHLLNQDCLTQIRASLDKQEQYVPFLNQLQQLRMQIMHGINFNKQLMIESVLIQWLKQSSGAFFSGTSEARGHYGIS